MEIQKPSINSKLSLTSYQDANVYQVVNTCNDSQNVYYELLCIDFKQKELISFDIECFGYNQVLYIKDTDLHLFKTL